uniref:Tas protein n=1 Tax=Simian foamy virus TaxID=11642 RepID=K7YKV0_9RETR|nr:tas protein [Simian foamy virus]
MDTYQEEESVASTSGVQDLQTLSELVGPEAAGEGEDTLSDTEEVSRRSRKNTKRGAKMTTFHAYKEIEDKNPQNLKLHNWIPTPEEMSKSICSKFILHGLYSAEKVIEILNMPFEISWDQSETNPKCFIVSYTCIYCSAIIHEPMPVTYNADVGVWVKFNRLRGVVGSAVFMMKKHEKNCCFIKPSPSKQEGPKPRPRHDPVLRCKAFERNYKPRQKRPRPGPISNEPCASSSDPLAVQPGSLCTDPVWDPTAILQVLSEQREDSQSLAIHMSGGPFWEEVYGDSYMGPPTGPGDHTVL